MDTRNGIADAGKPVQPSQAKEGLGEWLTLYRVLKPSVRDSWFRLEDRVDKILHPGMPPMDVSDRGKKYVGRLHEVYEYLAENLNQLPDAELRKLFE